ncbi:MAG: hypothetical protein JWN33_70 [Candidatus Saccharibacteria bacterium]|nr:hypothetical protein [Candidatus Saccharibacteria bacterium]
MTDIAVIIIHAAVGLTMVLFGVNQLIWPQHWFSYVPQFVTKRLPGIVEAWGMRFHGLINITLGALFALSLLTPALTWVTFAWWISVVPFAFLHDWRDGLRDICIVTGLFFIAVLGM